MTVEKMDDFFTKRIDEYDSHMLNNVPGCKEAYFELFSLIPNNTKTLLDLGCGTGLELDLILKTYPDINITGIDLNEAMLNKLKNKYSDKNIVLINENYLNYNFNLEAYDVVISFQTLHHFSHEIKLNLYSKIYSSIKSSGLYIECDYMVNTVDEELLFINKRNELMKNNDLNNNELFHIDIPFSIDTQKNLFKKAGFKNIEQKFRIEDTTILLALK